MTMFCRKETMHLSLIYTLLLVVCCVYILDCSAQNTQCSRNKCKLPDCFCAGHRAPMGLSPKETPQIVMVSFDDTVEESSTDYYRIMFNKERTNPNGCPILATFFVTNNWTDYDVVRDLYLYGHEVASHSLTHRLPTDWWARAQYDDWEYEIVGQRDKLTELGRIPQSQIRGMRAPYLEMGKDAQFWMMTDNDFIYDSSCMAGPYRDADNSLPVWPFTLDYPPTVTYCDNAGMPKSSFPGIWEIPLNRWLGLDGFACPMVDSCSANPMPTKDDVLKYIWKNFNRHYRNGRAPFGIHLHTTWLEQEHHLEALEEFLDIIGTRDDIYVTTIYQVIEWMKKPTPVEQIKEFEPWKTSCKKGRILVREKSEDDEEDDDFGKLQRRRPVVSSGRRPTTQNPTRKLRQGYGNSQRRPSSGSFTRKPTSEDSQRRRTTPQINQRRTTPQINQRRTTPQTNNKDYEYFSGKYPAQRRTEASGPGATRPPVDEDDEMQGNERASSMRHVGKDDVTNSSARGGESPRVKGSNVNRATDKLDSEDVQKRIPTKHRSTNTSDNYKGVSSVKKNDAGHRYDDPPQGGQVTRLGGYSGGQTKDLTQSEGNGRKQVKNQNSNDHQRPLNPQGRVIQNNRRMHSASSISAIPCTWIYLALYFSYII